MSHQYSFNEDPIGCGLVGCLGGLIFGLVGGGILLVVAALTAAIVTPMPSPTPSQTQPDLQVTVDESFLNRFTNQPAEGMIRIDVLPDNQVQLIVNTTIQIFGAATPVQITGLFEMQLIQQKLQVQLIDTQVLGIPPSVELANFFSEDLSIINQDLNAIIDDISGVLGTSIVVSNVNTTETQIQLDIQEIR